MSDLQGVTVIWLSMLVAWLPFGYVFSAGMIAAVNPCGFAMLPAYLSLYLGTEESAWATKSGGRRVLSGIGIGIAVSSGFVLLFAAVGVVISVVGHRLLAAMPWVGVLIGVLMAGMGLAMLAGRTISPAACERLAARFQHSGKHSISGFFLFGVAYGLASLSCTLPIFMVAVGGALIGENVVLGFTRFLSYSFGMAAVVVTLTIALGLFKLGLLETIRGATRYTQAVSGVLLIIAGGWIILFWGPYV